MVITILEAHVSKENWKALEDAYLSAIRFREPGLVRTFLIQGVQDTELWRIVTIWRSREALEEMRKLVEIPRGVLIFRKAHAEPALSVFNVVHHFLPD